MNFTSSNAPTSTTTERPIRRALRQRTPDWLDPLFTWLTGLAGRSDGGKLQGQALRVVTPFILFYGGIWLGVAALTLGTMASLLMLPLAWTIAIGGARDLQLTIYHNCAHQTVLSKTWSLWLGRIIATILVIERFDTYELRHRIEHHGRHFLSTLADPTVDFLVNIVGVIPGASIATNRYRLLRALVSPSVHLRLMWRRLNAQFGAGASWGNRLGTLSAFLALVVPIQLFGGWSAVIFGVLIPLVWGYQASQILRLVVEHGWPSHNGVTGRRAPADYDALTVSIRCAVAPPETWTPKSLCGFVTATLFNAWIRFVVLPGDSGPNHHWHHGEPRGDWANHIVSAARWEERRMMAGARPVREVWGFDEAFRLALESYSKASMESLSAPLKVQNLA